MFKRPDAVEHTLINLVYPHGEMEGSVKRIAWKLLEPIAWSYLVVNNY